MATLVQIRNQVDSVLAGIWPTFQATQDTYAANHGGRYFQGLRTHAVEPADGNTALPDVGSTTPTDQPTPWPPALLSSPYPFALRSDVYDGPLGRGYVATVYVRVLGTLYSRSQNVGPETWRTANWTQVVAVN